MMLILKQKRKTKFDTMIFREIRKLQKITNFVIAKFVFDKLMREITHEIRFDFKIQRNVFVALQKFIEFFFIILLENKFLFYFFNVILLQLMR